MSIIEMSATDYQRAFPQPRTVFNSVAFSGVNAAKVRRIIYAVAVDESAKPILGLTIGEREDGSLRAPFSAPFIIFDYNRAHRNGTIISALRGFIDKYRGLSLTLPPPFYSPAMNSKLLLALQHAGAKTEFTDWNYHFDLTQPYLPSLTSDSRKKINVASREGFYLERSNPERAYEIIRRNREHKGYPLRMTLEQLLATVQPAGPVRADFFVLTDGTRDAASAVIYHVAPGIAQVIYWGNVPESPCRFAMNLLAAKVCEHYAAARFHIVDLGPSSEYGEPDLSLADFKESVGAICTPRPTLQF